MEKPIKPIQPKPSDFPPTVGYANEKTPFIVASRKYNKDLAKYESDMELYEQTKFIKDIQRSTLKLCLKKYNITKKK